MCLNNFFVWRWIHLKFTDGVKVFTVGYSKMNSGRLARWIPEGAPGLENWYFAGLFGWKLWSGGEFFLTSFISSSVWEFMQWRDNFSHTGGNRLYFPSMHAHSSVWEHFQFRRTNKWSRKNLSKKIARPAVLVLSANCTPLSANCTPCTSEILFTSLPLRPCWYWAELPG